VGQCAMEQHAKGTLMYWGTRIATVGGAVVILVGLWGGLMSFFREYHAKFALAEEFKQLGKDYREFSQTTRIGDKRGEIRFLEREVRIIHKEAHGRAFTAREADDIRKIEIDIKKIYEEIKDLKGKR